MGVIERYRINVVEYGQEERLTQPFDEEKHISPSGDLLLLLALQRTKWKADGLRVAELLKEFHLEMSLHPQPRAAGLPVPRWV